MPPTKIIFSGVGKTRDEMRDALKAQILVFNVESVNELRVLDERTRAIRDVSAANAAPSGPAPILAPMPGLVIRVNVNPGDRIEAGHGVVVMEAMKMENELRATTAGTVKSIKVAPGTAVERGALLVELE